MATFHAHLIRRALRRMQASLEDRGNRLHWGFYGANCLPGIAAERRGAAGSANVVEGD